MYSKRKQTLSYFRALYMLNYVFPNCESLISYFHLAPVLLSFSFVLSPPLPAPPPLAPQPLLLFTFFLSYVNVLLLSLLF